jgi:undecaprenyl-phosphate 4-deoxy-4-formamido-L-arabinose transferase
MAEPATLQPSTPSLATAEVDVSVVIPVLNEEEGIERCHAEVTRVLDASGLSYELVYVDDGSADRSLEKMRAFGAKGRVLVIQLRRNMGQQRALWLGLRHANARVVITYDSDLQFVPECLPDLVKKVNEGFDIVSGIRETRHDPLLANRLPSWFGQFLINKALRVRQKDFGAVKAYSRKLASSLAAITQDYLILPAAAYTLSKKFAEIPVGHQARSAGMTKWSLLRRVEFYLNIFTAYAPRPFEWMMVAGAISLFLSFVLFFAIVLYRIFVADFRGTIVFFDVFLFTTGLQLFSTSIVGEFVVRAFRARHSVLDESLASIEQVHRS